MTLSFRADSAVDIGRVRSSMQDTCLVSDDLFAVADGMGGHSGGEVASQLAIEAIRDHFVVPTTDALVEAVQAANDAVLARADEEPDLRGMGTTLVALASVITDGEERLAVANVGDSRCYLLEGDRLRQITKDHSVVQTLVDNGQITAAEAELHPQRNILTRALGIDARVMTDSWELRPVAGDRYLLCSDGLFNEVDATTIARVLREESNPADASARLVALANEGGGRDNISVVVIDVLEDGGYSSLAEATGNRIAVETPGGRRAVATATMARPTAEPPAEGPPEAGDGEAPARKGPGFRTIAFVGALIAIAVVVIGTVLFASRGTYHVGFQGDIVTIFEGPVGGFLGQDPSVKERTDITRDEVPPSYLDELESGVEFSSLEDAQAYVDRIEADIADQAGTGGNPPPPVATTAPPADGSDGTTAPDGSAPPGSTGTTTPVGGLAPT